MSRGRAAPEGGRRTLRSENDLGEGLASQRGLRVTATWPFFPATHQSRGGFSGPWDATRDLTGSPPTGRRFPEKLSTGPGVPPQAAVKGLAWADCTHGAGHPEEAPTMLVGCIDVCPKVQEALQARQALRLLAGQVQGAALVDLSQEGTAGWPGRCSRPYGTLLRAGRPAYPVPAIDVGPVAHQQLHHIRLVSQDRDVQGRVVGDRV